MRRFLISDMHFGHKNILKYENRPFKDLHEMEREIRNNWNNTVAKNDMVFVLGDISFDNVEQTAKIIQSLYGRKILIIGNHDTRSVKQYLDMGFESVYKWPIIVDEFFILSHAPVYLNDAMPYANIHGHLHGKNISGNYFNVSVENIDYTPIDFDKVKKALRADDRSIDQRVDDLNNYTLQQQLDNANRERIDLARKLANIEAEVAERNKNELF